jgi:hypothetical protein
MFSSAVAAENGKQAIKTAIAGVAAMYITRLFQLPEGYWAAISALIVMQSNVGATLDASRTRLAGTAVGAVVGGVFVALWGANILGFGLAVTIAFFICTELRLAESQRLATVTVAIIMLIRGASAAWVIALHRFAEVALGILIALVISLTLWPNHARRSLRSGLAEALVNLSDLYQAAMGANSVDRANAQVSDVFRKNAALLENALHEAFGPMRERESLALLAAQVERIRDAVDALKLAVRDGAADTYPRKFDSELAQVRAAIVAAFGSLASSLRAGRTGSQWPQLTAAVSALDAKATLARTSGATASHPLDEILRFYALLLSTRNLTQELELARSLVARLIP